MRNLTLQLFNLLQFYGVHEPRRKWPTADWNKSKLNAAAAGIEKVEMAHTPRGTAVRCIQLKFIKYICAAAYLLLKY